MEQYPFFRICCNNIPILDFKFVLFRHMCCKVILKPYSKFLHLWWIEVSFQLWQLHKWFLSTFWIDKKFQTSAIQKWKFRLDYKLNTWLLLSKITCEVLLLFLLFLKTENEQYKMIYTLWNYDISSLSFYAASSNKCYHTYQILHYKMLCLTKSQEFKTWVVSLQFHFM